eukprot:364943-Chlamydomonas_euryale.AAC.29
MWIRVERWQVELCAVERWPGVDWACPSVDQAQLSVDQAQLSIDLATQPKHPSAMTACRPHVQSAQGGSKLGHTS